MRNAIASDECMAIASDKVSGERLQERAILALIGW